MCNSEPRLARKNGCDGLPAPQPVLEMQDVDRGIVYVFWHCPTKFIPVSISEWYRRYWYNERTNSHPNFAEATERYKEAMRVYVTVLSEE